MWLSYTEHYGSVWYRVCFLLYHGHLVQNIMLVYDMESIISVMYLSYTEHYGSVWYREYYCCTKALLYRTLW